MKNKEIILKALEYYGERSVHGKENNPVIMEFFNKASHQYILDDEVPWCAAFMNAVLYDLKMPMTKKLNARSFLDLGVEVEKPEPGDIVILWRGQRDSIYGHVGIFIREDEGMLYILGGNQDSSVSIKPFPKSRLLGYRSLIIN